ncbi:MAG: O-methyltransferase [Clostridiales bacterium]|nr:O-methyltransferase [Clostridiales bacterium]
MIVDERLVTYINSLDSGNTEILDDIERNAIADAVPVIRKETQNFLKLLLAMKRPKRILEVGTAVGFSALFMAEYDPVPCEIVTIENYEKRINVAKENFHRAGMENKITLLEGDAAEVLGTLEEPFDFIFMDAAKGQYINFLPEVMRLLNIGGTLVSDNVLQDGTIIESHYAVTRRNRTIYKRMREYLYELTHRDDMVTAVLPVGDGVTVSEKIYDTGDKSNAMRACSQLRGR